MEQRAAGKSADVNNPDGLVDGSLETNLGMFRAYMKLWLDANDQIAQGGICFCFVTTLPQTQTEYHCRSIVSPTRRHGFSMRLSWQECLNIWRRFCINSVCTIQRDGIGTAILSWMAGSAPEKNPDVLFGLSPFPFFNRRQESGKIPAIRCSSTMPAAIRNATRSTPSPTSTSSSASTCRMHLRPGHTSPA